ncbi:MAG: S8 family serine peptidase [Sedimentisphaerales bacterium]|nr:S8 family serine peptidase [Sedimentisphaerales bacterium]
MANHACLGPEVLRGSRARLLAGSYILLIILTASVQAAEVLEVQPENFKYAGIDKLQQENPSLTGKDTSIAVICRSLTYINGQPQNDYRPDVAHHCFGKTEFEFYDDGQSQPGLSNHSTSICSILFGYDPNASTDFLGKFTYKGIAYQSKAQIFEFWHFLKNNVFVNKPPQADVISASIGSVFEDWWTRGTESMAEHHGTIIVAGIGNGTEAFDPPLYPAACSNIIGVGVVDTISLGGVPLFLPDWAQANPANSTSGPTQDGRHKPDLIAPGDMFTALSNEPNNYELCGGYTSFATPTVAGTAALLIQYAKSDANLKEDFESSRKNCLIKAILMNSAKKLPYWHKGIISKADDYFAPLDRVQGAGMLDAFAAHKSLSAGRYRPGPIPDIGWDSGELKTHLITGKTYQLDINEPNDKLITATICWNRHFEESYPFNPSKEKDADIRLELWTYDSTGQMPDRLVDFSDSKTDNVEHIYCPADVNYTEYKIVAVLTNTDGLQEELTQQYSLAWSVTQKPKQPSMQWLDLNCDGIIDETDFSILLNNVFRFTQQSEEYLTGDINQDGRLDMKDVDVFLDYFGPLFDQQLAAVNN